MGPDARDALDRCGHHNLRLDSHLHQAGIFRDIEHEARFGARGGEDPAPNCRARRFFACIVEAQSKQEPVHRLPGWACDGFTVVISRAC